MYQSVLGRFVRPTSAVGVAALPPTMRLLTAAARSFRMAAPAFQRAADVYSPTASSSIAGSSVPSSSGSHPPPPPPGGRHLFDRRSGDKEESGEDQAARYLRNM